MIGKSIFIFEDTDFEKFVGSRCDLDYQVKIHSRDEEKGTGIIGYKIVEKGDNWYIA
jgi:hypothetical protein